MTRVVDLARPLEPDTLYVASAALRSYLGVSRDGTYVHHVRAARLDDQVVGDGLRHAGELTCDCSGGRFRGSCYWTKRAEALEARTPEKALTVEEPNWFDSPAGAGESVEAFRG